MTIKQRRSKPRATTPTDVDAADGNRVRPDEDKDDRSSSGDSKDDRANSGDNKGDRPKSG